MLDTKNKHRIVGQLYLKTKLTQIRFVVTKVEVGDRERAWAVTPLTSPLRPTVCLYGVPGDGLHGHVPQAAPEERAAGAPDPRHCSYVLPDRALPGH